jgi:hypothetical protein
MIQVKTMNQTETELLLSEIRKQDVYCVMSKESSTTIPKLRQHGSSKTTSVRNGVNKQQFVVALINRYDPRDNETIMPAYDSSVWVLPVTCHHSQVHCRLRQMGRHSL